MPLEVDPELEKAEKEKAKREEEQDEPAQGPSQPPVPPVPPVLAEEDVAVAEALERSHREYIAELEKVS
jgi:hypothetical protein